MVDDDEGILTVVRIILQTAGYEVKTHDSGIGVPEIVSGYSPDLILLDVRLPGKAGTEICQELKATYNMPIILFSAHANYRTVLAACDAEAFIEKPFDVKNFLITIQHYLN